MLLALIHNVAILIMLAYVFGLAIRGRLDKFSLPRQILWGCAVAAITLTVMYTRWELEPGVVFDARSVPLAVSGLFFGAVPTGIAMIAAAIYRLSQGGLAMSTGVSVILSSGVIGVLWRHARKGPLEEVSVRELLAFGLLVHVVMILFFFLIPAEVAGPLVRAIFWPVLLVHPLATVLLGKLMAHHLQVDRAQRLLLESEERYRSLFENEHTAMMIIDPTSGQIEDANPAAVGFYRSSKEALIGERLSAISLEDESTVLANLERALAKKQQRFLARHRLADGSIRHVECYLGPVERDGRAQLYAILHDVTEQKTLETQFRQAQKMDAVGRLAGGVAHDFNNKLQAILGYAEFALQRDIPDSVREDLTEIRDASMHSAELTRHLLAFARRQPAQPEVIDFNEAIARMLRMLKRMIGENIIVHWTPCKDGWKTNIDPTQLDQILANLVVNSRDAIGDEGHLFVETHNMQMDDTYSLQHAYAKPGDYVMLAVADTGKGMSKRTMEQIFEPFFTTKGLGSGTGLGLSTVYGIVKQNNGFIHAYSEEGVGTTMKVYLPRAEEEGEAGAPSDAVHKPEPRGSETVLLAEDEWPVFELTRTVLLSAGYKVVGSDNPREALRLAETHDTPIHLVITDVIMPGINGKQFSEKVKALYPDARVLYMSGFTAEAITKQGLVDAGEHFLQKPFSVAILKRKVREVLGHQSGEKDATKPA